ETIGHMNPSVVIKEARKYLDVQGMVFVTTSEPPWPMTQADLERTHYYRYQRGRIVQEFEAAGLNFSEEGEYVMAINTPRAGKTLIPLKFYVGRANAASGKAETKSLPVLDTGAAMTE